ncbi:hypothetical protein MKX03_027462 [Papaver bracteatum]|nr:hypothetical protein MKX03_027462 [Papaver bracteatum]
MGNNNFKSLEQVAEALAKDDMATSSLIVGIDFSINNTWAGRRSFNGRSLHQIGDAQNPYEQVLWLTGRTLAYMKDKLIHCFGFGDGKLCYSKMLSFFIFFVVGDEPPSMVLSCRENSSLRAYDNFKYVNFTEIMSRDAHLSIKEIEFALAAFKEISKHKNTNKRKLLGVPLLPPIPASLVSKSCLTIHDKGGPWFDRVEHESPISMISDYEGVIHIGLFAALYKRILGKHGHLATRNIIKTSTLTLATLVAELLKSIAAMQTVKRDELSVALLGKWDRQIADAEALQFNVQWLRRHFENVKKSWEDESLLRNSQLTQEKKKAGALGKSQLHAQNVMLSGHDF